MRHIIRKQIVKKLNSNFLTYNTRRKIDAEFTRWFKNLRKNLNNNKNKT